MPARSPESKVYEGTEGLAVQVYEGTYTLAVPVYEGTYTLAVFEWVE
jgi:hypothetical protein